MNGLSKDQRVIVRFPKNKKAWGVIKEVDVFARKYLVLIDMAPEPEWFPMSRVRPDTRKSTAKLEIPDKFLKPPYFPRQKGLDHAPPRHSALFPDSPRPIPKPDLPEECPAWLAMVRKRPCSHHEGKKDAFAQKVRDTLAVPLCKICHSVYTQKNRLPLYTGVKVFRDEDLLSREDSLKILQGTQARLLTEVFEALDQPARIELLSKGIANQRTGELAKLLGRISEAA